MELYLVASLFTVWFPMAALRSLSAFGCTLFWLRYLEKIRSHTDLWLMKGLF